MVSVEPDCSSVTLSPASMLSALTPFMVAGAPSVPFAPFAPFAPAGPAGPAGPRILAPGAGVHAALARRPAEVALGVHGGEVVAARRALQRPAVHPLGRAAHLRPGVDVEGRALADVVVVAEGGVRDRGREGLGGIVLPQHGEAGAGSPVRPVRAGRAGLARVALVALGPADVGRGRVFEPAVVRPGEQPARDARRVHRPRRAARALDELRRAGAGLDRAGREDVGRYERAHSITSEVASATAKDSILCTPTTSPPTNFTRMSSVTVPFAGKAKVSACVSGR